MMSCSAFANELPADPASAIPWLTESLQAPLQPNAETTSSTSTDIETISVQTLSDNDRDGLGVLSSDVTGFPADLWGAQSAAKVLRLIKQTPYGGVPAVRDLFRQVLLAETSPPADISEPDSLFLARVDRLLEIGALSEAQALIALSGPNTSELFRRWFDIGLLTNNADQVCSELDASPMLSPARSVQVFCLALGRDWSAAATSLALGEDLGQITEDEADLLSFYLDEALLEEMEPPPVGKPLTSLEFVIRESVGLPRPTTRLPIAFMHAELADYVPQRFRIEAGEVLVREGLLPPSVLFAAYREEEPAASGGVWRRPETTQAMDEAATADEISDALRNLDHEFMRADLRMPAAKEFLLYLSELPADQFDDATRSRVALYLILAGASELAMSWITDAAPPDLGTALSIAQARFEGATPIERVLSTTIPEAQLSDYQAGLVARGEVGVAIMAAIDLLARNKTSDEDDLLNALALLRAVGQEQAARKIAVQTLLIPLRIVDAN